jgi:hypothetical protein
MTTLANHVGLASGRLVPLAMSALLVTSVMAAHPALAEGSSPIESRGYFSVGAFLNKTDLKIRLDGSAGEIGDEVDWGKTFGGDSGQTRFRLDGLWRFSDKHHLRLMFTDYTYSKTRTLDEDIQWGDDLILASSSVKSKLGFQIAEAAYEYAVKHDENMELALSAGVHYTAFVAKLNVNADTTGGSGGAELGGKASVGAPLPVFGGHGLWHLGNNLYADAQLQWFALSIDGYDGSILNYRGSIYWQPKKWGGIGLGYDSFNVDLKVKKDKFTGKMNWTYQGPQLFFNFTF